MGRTTWRGRETMEQHVLRCWHCIDHFSRMVEVVELIRGVQPLTEEQAAPFRGCWEWNRHGNRCGSALWVGRLSY